jgi:hypothetical protein
MSQILDANVIVSLCQRQALGKLALLPGPWLVPQLVEEEVTSHEHKYPDQVRQYQEALKAGVLQVAPMPPGSHEEQEFMRLRSKRSSPQRNRGDDACVALAMSLPGSTLWTGDHKAAARARVELGEPARVRTREELLALLVALKAGADVEDV